MALSSLQFNEELDSEIQMQVETEVEVETSILHTVKMGGRQVSDSRPIAKADFYLTLEKSIVKALNQIESDPMVNLAKSKYGNEIKQCAMYCMNGEKITELLEIFGSTLYDLLKCPPIKQSERERMFSKFHTLRYPLSEVLVKRISIQCSKQVLFAQMLTRIVLDCTLSAAIAQKTELCDDKDYHISLVEQQVLFYVAGYIINKLRKGQSKTKSLRNHSALLCNLETKDMSDLQFEGPLAKWTESLDRGGLKYSGKDFYLLIKRMDYLATKNTSAGTQSILKKPLMMIIMDDFVINIHWISLVKASGEDEEECSEVLCFISNLFLTIKGFAIARRLRNAMEKKEKQHKQSLRSSLKQCKDGME